MVREMTASEAFDPSAISSDDEHPTFFEAGGETLFGIHTLPRRNGSDAALVMLPSAERLGYHRNRMGVALAHRLAERGLHAFRIDYRGTGESTGKAGRFRLDDPYTADATGAAAWLRGQGLQRFFYTGSCFGARVSVAAAIDEPETTAGLILLSMPMIDHAAGERGSMNTARQPLPSLAHKALRLKTFRDLRDPDLRRMYGEAARHKIRRLTHRSVEHEDGGAISPPFLAALRTLLTRRVPMFLVYGETDGAYAEFLEAKKGELGGLLEQAGDTVEIAVVLGRLHGFTSVPGQEAMIDLTTDWIARIDRGVRRH